MDSDHEFAVVASTIRSVAASHSVLVLYETGLAWASEFKAYEIRRDTSMRHLYVHGQPL